MDVLVARHRDLRDTKQNLPLFLLIGLLMIFLDQVVLAQSAIPEYRVKATFLFQFTQFVDWPRNAFSNQQTPLVIGILGEDPFGTFLDDTVGMKWPTATPLQSSAISGWRMSKTVRCCLSAGRRRTKSEKFSQRSEDGALSLWAMQTVSLTA